MVTIRVLHRGMVDAYFGYYEEEISAVAAENRDQWVADKITTDSPSQRLEVYLKWNGILGFHRDILHIATGNITK